MDVIYKHQSTVPYSLHDMRVSSMERSEQTIRFYFEYGYIDIRETVKQVAGNLRIEGVDLDFSHVYFLSEGGQCGEFHGKKMELAAFLQEYQTFDFFEVMDEMYGYNAVIYQGHLALSRQESLIEVAISIYYTGNLVFELED